VSEAKNLQNLGKLCNIMIYALNMTYIHCSGASKSARWLWNIANLLGAWAIVVGSLNLLTNITLS